MDGRSSAACARQRMLLAPIRVEDGDFAHRDRPSAAGEAASFAASKRFARAGICVRWPAETFSLVSQSIA